MTDETPDPGPQRRLAEYGDVAPPVEREEKRCERCGGEPTGDADPPTRPSKCPPAPPHHRSKFDDVEATPDRVLCGRCASLEQYLTREYHRRRQQLGVTAVVAVFCQCHDRDEVDLQSVYAAGADPDDISCSRCGSQQVVIETLPPTPDDYAEVTQ